MEIINLTESDSYILVNLLEERKAGTFKNKDILYRMTFNKETYIDRDFEKNTLDFYATSKFYIFELDAKPGFLFYNYITEKDYVLQDISTMLDILEKKTAAVVKDQIEEEFEHKRQVQKALREENRDLINELINYVDKEESFDLSQKSEWKINLYNFDSAINNLPDIKPEEFKGVVTDSSKWSSGIINLSCKYPFGGSIGLNFDTRDGLITAYTDFYESSSDLNSILIELINLSSEQIRDKQSEQEENITYNS